VTPLQLTDVVAPWPLQNTDVSSPAFSGTHDSAAAPPSPSSDSDRNFHVTAGTRTALSPYLSATVERTPLPSITVDAPTNAHLEMESPSTKTLPIIAQRVVSHTYTFSSGFVVCLTAAHIRWCSSDSAHARMPNCALPPNRKRSTSSVRRQRFVRWSKTARCSDRPPHGNVVSAHAK